MLPNCPQHVVAFYAVLRLGAIVVEHNPLYTPPELRHQFEDHGARVAIVWNSVADTVAEFPSDIRPAHIVAVDLTRGAAVRQADGAAPADPEGQALPRRTHDDALEPAGS